MIEIILNEVLLDEIKRKSKFIIVYFQIMDNSVKIEWDDIAGLHHAKTIIKEMVVWPMLRP